MFFEQFAIKIVPPKISKFVGLIIKRISTYVSWNENHVKQIWTSFLTMLENVKVNKFSIDNISYNTTEITKKKTLQI